MGLSRWLSGKEFTCQCKSHRFDSWGKKIPGEGNGNPLQYSCLENPMDKGTWRETVQKSWTWLSDKDKVYKTHA